MGNVKRPQGTKVQGRPVVRDTVLGKVMQARRLTKLDVCAVLHVSDRQLYDYMTREDPVPPLKLGALADFLDVDPDYLVDARGFLKRSHTE